MKYAGIIYLRDEQEEVIMKLVVAYIRPESLKKVKQALYENEIYKMSVTNALGCGQQQGRHEQYRGLDVEVNLLKKVRIEIALNDELVDPALEAIVKGARSDRIGDGKVFVLDLPKCLRIRTGETDAAAIG